MKVLFLTNIPSPYRMDFFNELGKLCELTVLFEREDADDRNEQWLKMKNENFKAVLMKGKKFGSDSAICFDVLKYLNKKKFDIIVVGGYSTPTGMLSISYLKLRGIPFILNSDGGFVKHDENIIKRIIKKQFISKANYWLSSSKSTSEYLKYYGANEKHIFTYPFTSIFKKDILKNVIDDKSKLMIKQSLNICEEKIILSVGQFIHRKGFDILLESCDKIPKEYGVYIVGGEPTQEYIDLKNKLKLSNVHFVGFKTKEELKKYYMVSDIFALPTREDIWGLVINEAMAFGLPVITSDKCIAGLELVKNYENGFVVPVKSIKKLSENIIEILFNDELRNIMKKNNLEKITYYTIENMAKIHYDIFVKIIGDKNEH